MSVFQAKIEGVPQFVSYFAPVHRAMLQLGGQATPKQVYAHIAENERLAPEELAQVNQNGHPTFENRAAWARFYMTKAGWMYAPKRGVWALTEQAKKPLKSLKLKPWPYLKRWLQSSKGMRKR